MRRMCETRGLRERRGLQGSCWRQVGIGLLAAGALAGGAGPAAAEPARWTLQLDGGSEYDSNIHRLELRKGEEVEAIGAPVMRLGARHRLGWRRVARERLSLATFGGLKLFASESGQSENVAIVSGDGAYEWTLPGRGAQLGVQGSYYDAIPMELYEPGGPVYEGRTFRTGAGELTASLVGQGGQRVTALAGVRAFEYKPDPLFDWAGDHYGLVVHTTWWRGEPDTDDDASSIDLTAGYRVERRGYDSRARTSSCADEEAADPLCSAGTRIDRSDLNHSLAAELVYTGRRVYGARYELSVNDSNSHGESLVRQRLRLGVTSELWRDLFLTAEGIVLVNIYLEPLLLARDEQARTFVSIEEENRNSLSLHLSRALAGAWAIEARYALYSNEFTNEELSFRRQTVYLGAVYRQAN
jgi:hypothetical protein